MSFSKKVVSLSKLVLIGWIFFPLSLFSVSYHTVEKGDTLYNIAKRYGLSVSEIRKQNGLSDSDPIKIGKKLVIPSIDKTATGSSSNNSSSSSASVSAPKTPTQAAQPNVATEWESYTIKKGDTLYSLARTKGIALNQLLAKNGFSSNQVIKLGQKILVPKASGTTSTNLKTTTSSNSNNKGATVTNQVASIYSPNSSKGIAVGATNLMWPTDGKIFSLKGKVKGVQIEAKKGSIVKSISSGTVVWAAPFRGYGNMVVVQNSDYSYTYCGNESIFVKVGDKVIVGQKIGSVGVNAHDEDSKIILLTYKGETAIDPTKAPRQ